MEPSHLQRSVTLSNVWEATVNIEYQDGSKTFGSSESCILPASIGEVCMVPEGGEAILVACYVPDLRWDVITLLREAGYSDEEKRALGEVTGW